VIVIQLERNVVVGFALPPAACVRQKVEGHGVPSFLPELSIIALLPSVPIPVNKSKMACILTSNEWTDHQLWCESRVSTLKMSFGIANDVPNLHWMTRMEVCDSWKRGGVHDQLHQFKMMTD